MIPDTTLRGRMRTRCLALLVMTTALGPVVAQQGFQHALPEDTLVFVGVDDATAYGKDWAASSLGRFWASERLAPTRESIARDLETIRTKLTEEVGVDLLRLPEMIEGPVAIALLDLTVRIDQSSDEPSLACCLLMDVGEQREECQLMLDRLIEKVLAEEHEVVLKQQEVGGVAVTALMSDDPDEFVSIRLGFHGNTFVGIFQYGELARDPFLRVVDGLDGQADDVLDDSASFRASLAGGEQSGVRLYVDAGSILDSVFDGLEAGGELDVEETRTIASLGLRELGVLSMNMGCGEDMSTAEMRLDWRGDGWIQQIVRHLCTPGDFPSVRYVPADAHSFTAFNADFPGMFDTVSRMLISMKVITPAELVEALAEAENEMGFNPRDDLLELLTGEFVIIADQVDPSEALPFGAGDPTNYALIMGLHDGEAFTTLVDGVVRKTGFHVGRKSEEFQGFQVYQVPMPIPTISLGYAVLDDMAVLSLSPTMLRDVLRRRASSDLPNITGAPKYLEVLDRVDPGYGMIAFSDTASDLKQLVRTLQSLPGLVGDELDEDNALRWLAELPLPDESVIDEHFTGGTLTVCRIDESGLYFESVGP